MENAKYALASQDKNVIPNSIELYAGIHDLYKIILEPKSNFFEVRSKYHSHVKNSNRLFPLVHKEWNKVELPK